MDAIITYLDHDLSVMASVLSRQLAAPLNVFVFDHREMWEHDPKFRATTYRQTENILSQASCAWFVSERLIEEYAKKIRLPDPQVCRVLRPIPEGGNVSQATWSERFSQQPVVVHSGALQESHHPVILALADALASFGGKLILVERQSNPTAQECSLERENISHIPYFKKNHEAVKFIATQATAAVHMYSFSTSSQGWATASFPSKLIEYSHTGVPILLLSPPDTALHDWATSQQWEGLCDNLTMQSLQKVIQPLLDRQGWERLSAQSRAVAKSEFNPESIQKKFEEELVVKLTER